MFGIQHVCLKSVPCAHAVNKIDTLDCTYRGMMWKFKQNSLGGCCPVLVLSPTIVSMSARQIQVCRFIWCVGCSQVVITHAPFPNRWSQFCYSRKEATIRRFCKLVYFFWNRPLFVWSFLKKALFLLHSCAQKSYSRKEATIREFSKLVYFFWNRTLSVWSCLRKGNYFAQKSYSRKEATQRQRFVGSLNWYISFGREPYFFWTFVQELFLVGLLFGAFCKRVML